MPKQQDNKFLWISTETEIKSFGWGLNAVSIQGDSKTVC